MSQILLANRVYIPTALIEESKVEELYEQHCFVQTTCRNCPVFKDGLRPSQKCWQCTGDLPGTWNGYSGHVVQWKKVNIQGKPYYSIPAGDLYEIQREFGLDPNTFKDLRCRKPMDIKIEFTGNLYTGREVVNNKKMANQIGIVKKFWRTKYRSGIIQAPMRTGKTVLGAFFAVKAFRLKTLIVAHETILLRQFEKEIRRFTNIDALERTTGRRLLVVAEKEKDLKGNPEILLINYQKLISEIGIGRVLKYLQKRYGLLIVDEIHRAGTQHYEDLLNRLDPAYRIGFTATPSRRDGKDALFFRSLGPVVVKAKVDTLKPTIHITRTTVDMKKQYRGRAAFVKMCAWLSEQKDRNIQIVRQVFADLRENPNNVIVIPVMKVLHAKTLVAMINNQARINYEKRGEKWGDALGILLCGTSNKQQVIEEVRKRRSRVLVAIQKFVREGTNIEVLSHYYYAFPQNNKVSTQQGTGRILTPLEGKPDPIIRWFIDEVPICISCAKNTINDSFIPLGYKVAESSQKDWDWILRLEREPKTGKYFDPKDGNTQSDIMGMW